MERKRIRKSKLIKCVTAISILLSVVSLAFTAVCGCFLFKLFRYINTAQKAVPTIEEAAQLYIDNHSDDNMDDDDYNTDEEDNISF